MELNVSKFDMLKNAVFISVKPELLLDCKSLMKFSYSNAEVSGRGFGRLMQGYIGSGDR